MMQDWRRDTFLKEMGYTLWQLRREDESKGSDESRENEECGHERASRPDASGNAPVSRREIPAAHESLAFEDAKDIKGTESERPRHPATGASETTREITRETVRETAREFTRSGASATEASAPVVVHLPEAQRSSELTTSLSVSSERAEAIARMGWEELTEAIKECRACELCRHRKQAVPGVGDQKAEWLFIGEGPGAEEDARGEPFVGQAGRLLDAMLSAIDLKRGENVYIANAVKCRPEGNRTPLPAEMAMCRPFLTRQIALVRPSIIMLLGKAAVHSVLGDDSSLASLRKKFRAFDDIPVVVTYHPAYLLRNLPEKIKAWEDLCLARKKWREK